ncbi:MAG: histidine phosphatase family protein [Bryobacteraceae bacterium]
MSSGSQHIFLIRHGETAWSLSGQHTGRSDIALTERGVAQAETLGRFLKGRKLAVWTSPLQRARETCRLAGYEGQIDSDLIEWDYGAYEGRTTADIRKEIPNWSVWDSPIVGGETLEQVGARAANVIQRVTAATKGDIGLFAHGHILRILAACWLGLPPANGSLLALDTGTVSVLGYERQTRVIRQWNVNPG